ncbi:hypothetical protein FB451DRAFT_1389532 [Mycena latifolia]|nr:hypothetical protein FB451DRAFT_1418581 [Mycena latifolia]KAJ7490767.1 hypothetical protein FB451DRAFT_1389532 [Mycena latifolia]
MSFPAGTRVWYWTPSGQAFYGTVKQAGQGVDGVVYVEFRTDAGATITVPAVAVNKVV